MLSGGAAASGGSATSKAAAGLSSLVSWVRHSVLAGGSKRELDEDEQQLRHVRQQGGGLRGCDMGLGCTWRASSCPRGVRAVQATFGFGVIASSRLRRVPLQ